MGKTIIILLCLILNALLAAIEMAFVSVSKPQLRQLAGEGNKWADMLLQYRKNPERTLSILQICITLVGAISAAVGGAGAEESLSPILMNKYNLAERTADIISIMAVVIPLTYLNVVFSELVPKTYALRYPVRVSLFGARFLVFLDQLLGPLVMIFEKSTKVVVKLFQRKQAPLLPEMADINLEALSLEHKQIVLNLVNIEKKTVRDAMLPWSQVNTVKVSYNMKAVTERVMVSGHTRLPVTDDNGKVLGILHTKEFMAFRETGAENWYSIMRPVIVLREIDSLLKAMRIMREKRSHMSLVYSMDGNLVGIITLEDIIEEVVGDIYDEDDDGRIRRILALTASLKKRP